jgi:DNA-binding IclR family transcriptional regulator
VSERIARTPVGSQTLARGLEALHLVAAAPSGLTLQEVAHSLDVHRTVASRLLATLGQFGLVARHDDRRFRPAAALAVLGSQFDNSLRETSMPVLRRLADRTRTTVSLLVAEGDEQVAIAVVVPAGVAYHLSFQEGSRAPLERGAAGLALLASRPPVAGERDLVTRARRDGWVMTHGEIEANAYGLAVPIHRAPPAPATCINSISHRQDLLEQAREDAVLAARELADTLNIALEVPDR